MQNAERRDLCALGMQCFRQQDDYFLPCSISAHREILRAAHPYGAGSE